jgi:hypothetical protein
VALADGQDGSEQDYQSMSVVAALDSLVQKCRCHMYVYRRLGGASPTGKSFRFVSCVRAGEARRSCVGERGAFRSWC